MITMYSKVPLMGIARWHVQGRAELSAGCNSMVPILSQVAGHGSKATAKADRTILAKYPTAQKQLFSRTRKSEAQGPLARRVWAIRQQRPNDSLKPMQHSIAMNRTMLKVSV